MYMWCLDIEFYCRCGCGKEVNCGKKYIRGHSGRICTEETRRKRSLSHRGKNLSEEHKKNISFSLKGRIFSEDHKKKISIANSGENCSLETRQKLSVVNKGKLVSEHTRKKISLSNIDRICSEKTKEKISLGNKGKIRSEEARKNYSLSKIGEKNPNFGKHLSGEAKKNLSIKFSGENHPLWKGGRKARDEYYGPGNTRKLKKQIRIRDNNTCQECGKVWDGKENRFDPHHIDYNKRNHGLWNRITLCRSCHMKTNVNREYWQEKFSLLILAKYNRLFL